MSLGLRKGSIILVICLLTVLAVSIYVYALSARCSDNAPQGGCEAQCPDHTQIIEAACTYDGSHYVCQSSLPMPCGQGNTCLMCTDAHSYIGEFTTGVCVEDGKNCKDYYYDYGEEPCNNNGICEGAENVNGCPFDCTNCTDTTKRTDSASCEGTTTKHSQCRWCPVPAGSDGNPYPYIEPNQDTLGVGAGNKFLCVNITNDPFNCGKCGFGTASNNINHLYSDAGGGFCRTNTPFCMNGVCESGGAARTDETTMKSIQAYKIYHSEANSLFQPYTISCDATYGNCSAQVSGPDAANLKGSYDNADSNAFACAAVAGANAWNPNYGCCGNRKCRAGGTAGLCKTSDICDGALWHSASDPAALGEVFRLSNCFSPYPVARIGNAFMRCVDSDTYADYATFIMSGDTGGCVPGTSPAQIKAYVNYQPFSQWCDSLNSDAAPSVACPNEGQVTEDSVGDGAWPYACPVNTYPIAAVRVYGPSSTFGTCGLHSADSAAGSSGWLVCNSRTGIGYASIINTGAGGLAWKQQSVYDAWGQKETDMDAWCPPAVNKWKEFSSGADVSPVNGAFIPCPSMKYINALPAGPLGIALTGVDDTPMSKTAFFCANKIIPNPLYTLGFFKGNGTIMGNVSGHDYACVTDFSKSVVVNQSRAFVAICCGSSTSNCANDIPGGITGGAAVRYQVGDSITINSTKLYCLNDSRWSADLDYPSTQAACAKSYSATGNYCCSETDDTQTWLNESYNDKGSSKGTCFKGIPQPNNLSLKYAGADYKNVFVFNGSFHGCGFNAATFTPEYESGSQTCVLANGRFSQSCLDKIENWPNPGIIFNASSTWRTRNPLIARDDYCTLFNTSVRSYYCSYTDNWTDSNGQNLSHKSVVPRDLMEYFKNLTTDNTLRNSSCCLPDECWDPTVGTCISPQIGASESYVINATSVYKCLQGNWANVLGGGKKTPDGCFIGICPASTQCLYDIAGDPADNGNLSGNPQCLNNGQFIADNLCNNGSWMSRTKMLAEKLASIVGSGDFVLMCGPASDVIINTKQNLGASNNYCVLNKDGQRIIGTTLNQPLYNITHNDFVTALEQSFLLAYPDSGVSFGATCTATTTGFSKCVDNSYLKLYYDATYKMAIFSDQDISLNPSLGDLICNALPDWLKWLCPRPPMIETSLANLKLFNKVYGAKQSNKEIFGVAEQTCDMVTIKKSWVYTFNYTGLSSSDISFLTNNLAAENVTITPSQNNIFIKNPAIDAWTALTLLKNPEQE